MIEEKDISTVIKDRTDALGFFKLMGIKDVTTKRQKKNGTTVYELPMRRLSYTGNSRAYRYAIYDSGYIRDVSEYNSSPWYINKRYITTSKWWNKYYKEYTTYKGHKPAFIHDFDSQLVYLANYILKNRYRNNKMYSCCDWNVEQIKETCQFRHDAKWNSDTVSVSCDEYKKLQRTQWEKDNGVFNTWGTPLDGNDNVQVIINGHRYNLS